MGIGQFFKDLLSNQMQSNSPSVLYTTVTNDDVDTYPTYTIHGEIMRGAVNAAVDYISACCGKVEVQTYKNNKYTKAADWYRWNVKPNINQTSTEFWHNIVYNLIRNGEVLVVPIGEQLIVADSFCKDEKALVPTSFTGIAKKGYAINGVYNTTNSIYISGKYSTNLSMLINGLGTVLDETMNIAAQQYYKDGGEHGILHVTLPPNLSDDEKNAYVSKLNKDFNRYLDKRSGIVVLFEGQSFELLPKKNTTQKTSFVTDIREITKEAYSKVGQALKVPPALLLGDVANIGSDVIDNLINFAVAPIMDSFIEAANSVMYTPDEYLKGNYLKTDYTQARYYDAIECSTNIDKLHSNGMYSTNELRVKFGETPIEEDFADNYVLTKNYANVEESGDEDGVKNAER